MSFIQRTQAEKKPESETRNQKVRNQKVRSENKVQSEKPETRNMHCSNVKSTVPLNLHAIAIESAH